MLVVSADWHMRECVQGRAPDMTGDAAYGLYQLVEFCVRTRPSALLALGDLTDTNRPDSRSVSAMYAGMTQLQQAGVPVYFVKGDHDPGDGGCHWLSIHPWPTPIHGTTVVVDGLPIAGLDYCPHGTLREALANLPPGVPALATHQKWRDFVGSGECPLSDVPGHVRYLFTGDYHSHQHLAVPREGADDLLVLSPGSICQQSFGEESRKRFWTVSPGDGVGRRMLRSEHLRTRHYHDLLVGTAGALAETVERAGEYLRPDETLPEEVRRPALRVRYAPEVPGAHDALVAAFPFGRCHLFLEAIPVRERAEDPDLLAAEVEMDELLGRELESRGAAGNEELFRLARRLRDSADPAADVEAMETADAPR